MNFVAKLFILIKDDEKNLFFKRLRDDFSNFF